MPCGEDVDVRHMDVAVRGDLHETFHEEQEGAPNFFGFADVRLVAPFASWNAKGHRTKTVSVNAPTKREVYGLLREKVGEILDMVGPRW